MSLRATSPERRRALKLAAQRTVERCGPQEFVAEITRVSAKTLSDYSNTGNDRHADTFMPVDVLADLILDCGSRGEVAPLLLLLCELAGGTFVRVPEPDRNSSRHHLELACVAERFWNMPSLISRYMAGEMDGADFRDQALPLIAAVMNDLAGLKQQLLSVDQEAAE